MDELLKAAADRIVVAIKDMPKHGYAEVCALDVADVGDSFAKTDRKTRVTDALVAGAKAANPRNDPDLKVFQLVWQLDHLLKQASQATPEPTTP